MPDRETVDVLVIGSGMGGATFAAGLASSGARILILERGERLKDSPDVRDPRAIFQRGVFRPQESWLDGAGQPFNPGNYYYVGGNTKLYGAVLARYRAEDFSPIEHRGGATPGWPFPYEELEHWYACAETLYHAHGALGQDPTEPRHSKPYPHSAVPDEPVIAEVRERMKRAGVHPFSLPLGVDIERWLKRGATTWDAFPNVGHGKMDAESCGIDAALRHENVELRTNAYAERLIVEADGKRIAEVEAVIGGERRFIGAKIVVLSAGAVNSAALLLRSGDHGLANSSDVVGRHFMNHNLSAVLAINPRFVNDSVYQKTLGVNDFYLKDASGGPPLGNIQLLGRVTAPILKSNVRFAPEWTLRYVSRHAVDWLAMSEDLPNPESRVTLDGQQIKLDWKRSNWTTHLKLVAELKARLRAAGFPILLWHVFDRRTPSHQCGTARFGNDPATSALDPYCRAWDHPNLFVVDASFLPTSAAVNPSLTIAAQALRVADHVAKTELRTGQ